MESYLRQPGKKAKNHASKYSPDHTEHQMHKLHRDLIQFEDFKAKILPALQADLKSGMTPKQLREKYQALVQARLITDALTTADEGKAAMIGKDIIDRVEGKAVERKETTHRFKDISDKELDAILASEEDDLVEMQERFDS